MSDDVLTRALSAHQQGRLGDAEQGYRVVLARAPRHADALFLLGVLLHQSGRSREALVPLRQLTAMSPRADALNTLGDAHRLLGELPEARAALERALAAAPRDAAVQTNLALTLLALGAREEALMLLFNSVATNPDHAGLRQLLAGALEGLSIASGDATVRAVLQQLVKDATVATQLISGAVMGVVKSSEAFRRVTEAVAREEDPFATAPDAMQALMADPLLVEALPRMIVGDGAMEQVLTAIRRWTLHRAAARDGVVVPESLVPGAWLAALAGQCFNTEYAWSLSDEERTRVAEARRALAGASAMTSELALALVASYGALSSLGEWESLATRPIDAWSAPLRPLIQSQVLHALDERARAVAMPSFTSSGDAVSQRVRAMYEANPYPRWLMAQRPPELTVTALIASLRAEISSSALAQALAGRRARILVAGCGTGQQPVHLALTHGDADVQAFDLSRASLAYGERMAFSLGIANLRFGWGDLLELPIDGEPYDVISCSGVLHHLLDPIAGWRRLLTRLAPHGVMKVGLYSTHARTGIAAARAFVETQGFTSDEDGLRACRQAILGLPATHPASSVREYLDFYSLSGVRDLLMHVQERSYTVPEIAAALSTLNLRFLGFQLPHAVQAQFRAEFSAPSATLDLAAWDAFETRHPATFRAMYQFWCCAC